MRTFKSLKDQKTKGPGALGKGFGLAIILHHDEETMEDFDREDADEE